MFPDGDPNSIGWWTDVATARLGRCRCQPCLDSVVVELKQGMVRMAFSQALLPDDFPNITQDLVDLNWPGMGYKLPAKNGFSGVQLQGPNGPIDVMPYTVKVSNFGGAPPAKTGHNCKRCKVFNEYATANQGAEYVCYECR